MAWVKMVGEVGGHRAPPTPPHAIRSSGESILKWQRSVAHHLVSDSSKMQTHANITNEYLINLAWCDAIIGPPNYSLISLRVGGILVLPPRP